jgi:hypothetical protein
VPIPVIKRGTALLNEAFFFGHRYFFLSIDNLTDHARVDSILGAYPRFTRRRASWGSRPSCYMRVIEKSSRHVKRKMSEILWEARRAGNEVATFSSEGKALPRVGTDLGSRWHFSLLHDCKMTSRNIAIPLES